MLRLLLNSLLFVHFAFIGLSQLTPTYDDIMVPMRDGETLEVDVYLPSGPGPFEVILIQTPYNKDLFSLGLPMGVLQNINSQPFAWVIVDWRGFYGSNAADLSNFDRGEDGYDVCEWISAQTWHADRIGTWGPSALGKVQYDTAAESHPNHTCAVPLVAHPHFGYNDYFYGGALEEGRLNQLDALGYGLSPVILANPYYNIGWSVSETNSWTPSSVGIPTLQIGGWYDHAIDKMMDWYEATRNNAAISVRDQQWLLVGPWVHGGSGAAYVGSSVQGELNYPNAEYVSDTMAWNFLNYYLLDTPNNWQNTPLITYYETGTNIWLTSGATRIDATGTNTLNFNQNGQLTSDNGVSSTSFVSNPSSPCPTIGGPTLSTSLDQGPYDQISLEARPDVITFETASLTTAVNVTGRITLDLSIESDQPDCDIVAKLVDVYPDGRNMLITDGIKRMRFRNGYYASDEAFMTPRQIFSAHIDLPFTNYTWVPGHKIKVYISGNSDIRWNINLQDGGTMYQPGVGNVANIIVHHSNANPSIITFPGNNPTLAIAEIDEKITIYPNPTKGKITIHGFNDSRQFFLYNLSGQLLKNGEIIAGQISIDEFTNGMYYLTIEDGKSWLIIKE